MRSKLLLSLTLLTLAATLPACTIIRYVEPPPKDDNSGGGTPVPPKNVDVLVMVELDRTTVSLAEGYQSILNNLTLGLAANGVLVRKLAIAPMYRRSGEAVPLIYGQGDPDSEFKDYGSAIAFFALDDGMRYLRDEVDADGENLAALGLDLGRASIYHPTRASTTSTPYFSDRTDGFIVVQMTARERYCAYDEQSCQLDGKDPASYFTQQSSQSLDWMVMADGASYSKERVFHLSVTTEEGVDEDTFITRCERKPGFDHAYLDYMEPSANIYYGPLAKGIEAQGAWSDNLDLCAAMSPVQAPLTFASVGRSIGKELGASPPAPGTVITPGEDLSMPTTETE